MSRFDVCHHGGAFWQELDCQFTESSRKRHVINADVLDAWFDPSPEVLRSLARYEKEFCRMSPPTYSNGLIEMISERYSVRAEEVIVGAGSSALWFLVATTLLQPASRMLLVEPSYGEYRHVGSNVIRCKVNSLILSETDGFAFNLQEWVAKLNESFYDLAVLVNPNNPTGEAVLAEALTEAIQRVPSQTLILIDEAYLDFWDSSQSLFERKDLPDNVLVLSSFSKRFALSGLRVAKLRANEALSRRLSARNPPWAVSMPGQIAGCAALRSTDYYSERYAETHLLRNRFVDRLRTLGFEVLPGSANWLNLKVPSAELFRRALESDGIYVRNLGLTAPSLEDRWIRIAVKDQPTNDIICDRLAALAQLTHSIGASIL